MRLGLSSAAAPDATLEELLAACVLRGLTVLELREGDGHRLTRDSDEAELHAATAAAAAAGVSLSGYRAQRGGSDLRLARLGAVLGVPLLIEDDRDHTLGLERANGLAAVGARSAIVVQGKSALDDAVQAVGAEYDVAWDVEPAVDDLGTIAPGMLEQCAERLRHIRILGGGPETAMQTERGVGDLMRRLALGGYVGTVLLSPSSSRYRIAWAQWLGRRGGWGCGGKAGTSMPIRTANTSILAGGER